MIDAITGATKAFDSNGQLVWGMQQHGGVQMRRCIFHLLHLNFESETHCAACVVTQLQVAAQVPTQTFF